MKIILDIKDSKANSVLELLNGLEYVKAKQISPYKAEVLEGLADAIEEVKRAEKGKSKLKKASELLNEL